MIRVPRAANDAFHIWRCAHFRDVRMAGDRREKAIDVDGAKTLCQGDMRVWREGLIADH